jgi:hypothetical protein
LRSPDTGKTKTFLRNITNTDDLNDLLCQNG